jgi:PAS domain S-box-containing protein
MSAAARVSDQVTALRVLLGGLNGRLKRYYPPWRSPRFWAVQGLVVLIALGHTLFDVRQLLMGQSSSVEALSPTVFFFIPAVYAALNFGSAGATATAVWCVALSLPNIVLLDAGPERLAELTQLMFVAGTTYFVGERTDREIQARLRAEASAELLRASATRYRSLFETSPAAILIVDTAGVIVEANPSADSLFLSDRPSLQGQHLVDLIDPAIARLLLDLSSPADSRAYVILKPGSSGEHYLRPRVTRFNTEDGTPVIQILLREVTEEKLRQSALQAYASNILRAQEAERQRIARELHDQAVQELVILCRRLDLAGGGVNISIETANELHAAREIAENVATALRDFARALRPPMLDDLGLVTAVRSLLSELAERAQLETRLDVEGEEQRANPDVELAMFRIAQEALRNVEQHARATQVSIRMRFVEGALELEVADDGAGFVMSPNTDLATVGHLGLLGMHERAETIGGRLSVDSTPGQGTRVLVAMPALAKSSLDLIAF